MNDNDLKRNAEGYYDPTAYVALSKIEAERADAEKQRFLRLRGCLLRVCELAGFKLEGPLILRDLRSGKEWRG